MRTNTLPQQTTRRMTPAQKAATLTERIEAGYRQQEAHLAEFRAQQAHYMALRAAGASEAECWQPWRPTADPRTTSERQQDAAFLEAAVQS